MSEPSTVRAVAYIARVQAGTVVVDLARRVIAAADPAEEILVGVGHRIARAGFRLADVSDELIEPNTPLARRIAGLAPLPPLAAVEHRCQRIVELEQRCANAGAPVPTGEGWSYEPTLGQLGLTDRVDPDLGPDAARFPGR